MLHWFWTSYIIMNANIQSKVILHWHGFLYEPCIEYDWNCMIKEGGIHHQDTLVWIFRLFDYIKCYSNNLRMLAPELFSSTAQDAIIYYKLVRYRSHWCRYIEHVLLNSNQVQKMWKFKFWKDFVGTIFWGGSLL
jgi:hypothetical protein